MRFLVATLLALLLAPATLLAEMMDVRELDGELLEFSVYWGGIHSADMTLTARTTGPNQMRFSSRAKSRSAVRLIYPLDSTIDSDVAVPMIRPLEYRKFGQEGWGRERSARVLFDYKDKVGQYYRDDKFKKALPITDEIQDPLSSIYFYRVNGCVDGKPLKMRISDGNKVSDSTIEVLGRETVTVPAGTFQTVKVSPTMDSVGGVFAKSPGARLYMWLTDDRYHRPVKIQSKIKVGDFTAYLEKLETPALPPSARLPALENPDQAKQ